MCRVSAQGGPVIYPGERMDDLFRNRLRIIQSDELPKFGLEGVLLANFPMLKKGMRICDFCCGSGIVPLLLTSRAKEIKITGIEIQPELSNLARRNVILNNLGEQIDIITSDICTNGIEPHIFDLITVNPPFFSVRGGTVAPHKARATARSQTGLTIADVVKSAAQLLREKGRLALIYRASGLKEVLKCIDDNSLGAVRIRFVHHDVQHKASTFLLECQYGRNVDGVVEPPLIVYEANGDYTREMNNVYFAGQGLESGMS